MNKVFEIHNSDAYGIIIETGCSTATSSKLLDMNGASKSVYYSLQPYSKDFETKRYGHFTRSVSKDFIESVINVEFNNNTDTNINYILASSWQLNNDKDPLQIPHGWFGLFDIKRDKKYYLHFTINRRACESYHDMLNGKHNPKLVYQETRDRLIQIIGYIGVNLIHTCISGNINEFDLNNIPENYYIAMDMAYNENELDLKLLMSVLEKYNNDYFLVFRDNKAIRLEDLLRENKEISILKGSFDPLHHGHVEMLEMAKKAHDGSTSFLISTFRYDKPHISSEEIQKRIEQINKHGYTLIVCKSILFYDTFRKLNYWSHNNLFYLPVGMDTLLRIYQTDIENIEKANSKITNPIQRTTIRGFVDKIYKMYPNFKFLVYNRVGYNRPSELDVYNSITEYIDREDDGISSTKIREGVVKNKLNN